MHSGRATRKKKSNEKLKQSKSQSEMWIGVLPEYAGTSDNSMNSMPHNEKGEISAAATTANSSHLATLLWWIFKMILEYTQ